MKRVFAGLMLIVMVFMCEAAIAGGKNVYEPNPKMKVENIDLSDLVTSALEYTRNEINDCLEKYYEPGSDDRSSAIDETKATAERYFKEANTSYSWPWFDYDVVRYRDTFEVITHVKCTMHGSKGKYQLAAKLTKNGYDWSVYYMKIGNETIIDESEKVPENGWLKEPEPYTSRFLRINLLDYDKAELGELKSRIIDELHTNHKISLSQLYDVIKISKIEVESRLEGAHSFSWPLINYRGAKEWDMYRIATVVKYKDDNGKQEEQVLSICYPINGKFEVLFLKVGDHVLIERREELPVKLREHAVRVG